MDCFVMSKSHDRGIWLVVGEDSKKVVADILFHKRRYPGILLSSDPKIIKDLTGLPDVYIYEGWNPDVMDRILAFQKKCAHARKRRECFIVLDNLEVDAVLGTQAMRDIFFNGRQYGIMLIIATGHVVDFPLYIRANIDYVFVGPMPDDQREKLWKAFFKSFFESFDAFRSVIDVDFLVVDNTVHSAAEKDCVFRYSPSNRAFQLDVAAKFAL